MIPFSPPHIDQKIIDEVVNTLKSGWITTGPKTKLFEKRLTEYTGCKKTLAVSSATAGLEIILRWFGVKPDDEVILPAYTYCATANVVVHCGATPVFVDINPNDFNISIEGIKKAITNKTKVIMPVDFAGLPCDYNSINSLVQHDTMVKLFNPESKEQKLLGRILVLSDAAHSIGATLNNNPTGSLTDITVFSFHAVKNITTAEGGAIAFNLPVDFNSEEIYNYLSTLILHGQNKDALAKTQKGNWEYDVIEAGYKANMTDIAASIGLIELERYQSQILTRRREIFSKYTQELSKHSWAQIPTFADSVRKSSFHIYPLRIHDIAREQRDVIIQRIFNKDVSVNVHFKPLPMMSFYKNLGYNILDYPTAHDCFNREISLPVYYDLSDDNINFVLEALIKSVEEVVL